MKASTRIAARRFKAEDFLKNIVKLRKPQGLGFEGFTAGDYRQKETVQFWPLGFQILIKSRKGVSGIASALKQSGGPALGGPAFSWPLDCSSGKRRKDLLIWA